MPEPQSLACPTCSAEMPADGQRCTRCGTLVSPVGLEPAVPSADEVEYRSRLQRALGDAYRLGALIGRGGFGAVYTAWDERLERPVAVKALRHDLFPTPAVLERFKREARAVARLQHPNILTVHTVGEGEGLAYMVMPKVDGESLRDRLEREGPLPVDDALRIGASVADALDAAHRAGLVHRDVKPGNILLDGSTGRALLMDFGVAKARRAESPALTGTGVTIGSPAYMSPEQARGEEVDHRSDIYSLAAVVYEMLTGRLPFPAPNLYGLVYQQVTAEPTPITELVPKLRVDTADAIMRGLAKDAADRWPDAAGVARVLEGGRPDDVVRRATSEDASWVGSRLPILFLLAVPDYHLRTLRVAMVTSGSDPEGRAMWYLIGSPVLFLLDAAIVLLLLDLLLRTFLTAYQTRSAVAVVRDLFRQPRWWHTWYPPGLRGRDDPWPRLPIPARIARSLIWLALIALPLALPLIFTVPILQNVYEGIGVRLPASLRVVIAVSDWMQAWWWIFAAWIVGTVMYLMHRHHVDSATVVHLIVPWRSKGWEMEEVQRLLR